MDVYIGTSGWLYDWNPYGLDWYLKNSGLNSVELNSSFYRFPYPNQVKGWARRTFYRRGFRWSVKIHRSISHYRKVSRESYSTFNKFLNLFKPLDKYVDFYLLQLPPRYIMNDANIDKIGEFIRRFGLEYRLAVEFRNNTWFNDDAIELSNKYRFIFVSVDSPQTSYIRGSNETIYLRMHGRTDWYVHYYTDEELDEVIDRILSYNIKRIYVYFNNDHDMLENSRRFRDKIYKKL